MAPPHTRFFLAADTARPYVRDVLDLSDPRRAPPREPVFNIPGIVALLALVMAAIAFAREFLLDEQSNVMLLAYFAFIPARYDATFDLPGGLGADIWTFVSYAFLHANLVHLGVNLIWMLAFATPVARRFGTPRFLAFVVVTAAAGALAHLIAYPDAMVPMIGASAVVSGAMAAAVRFAFSPGGALGRPVRGAPEHPPAASLLGAFREPRVLTFVAVWVVVNFLFGAAITLPGTEGAEVAWQAHMGGFFAGLLLFPLFDPIPRAAVPSRPRR